MPGILPADAWQIALLVCKNSRCVYGSLIRLCQNPIERCGPVLNTKRPHITYFLSHAAPSTGLYFPPTPDDDGIDGRMGEIVTSARLEYRGRCSLAGGGHFATKNPHFSYYYQSVHNVNDFLKPMI